MSGTNGHLNGSSNGHGKLGRPTLFTQKLADHICEKLAEGLSLREVCRGDGMPNEATVRQWALKDVQGFYTQYAHARELQAERWADEVLEISDDATNDWMERQNKDGTTTTVVDMEHIMRSRLRVDTRKWLLCKVLPKKYGEKVQSDINAKLTVVYENESSVRAAEMFGT